MLRKGGLSRVMSLAIVDSASWPWRRDPSEMRLCAHGIPQRRGSSLDFLSGPRVSEVLLWPAGPAQRPVTSGDSNPAPTPIGGLGLPCSFCRTRGRRRPGPRVLARRPSIVRHLSSSFRVAVTAPCWTPVLSRAKRLMLLFLMPQPLLMSLCWHACLIALPERLRLHLLGPCCADFSPLGC